MKTLGKRILAIALAAVMCFSTLHLTPLAADMKDQVMNGYYILNEDHSVDSTTQIAEKEQYGFTVSKTIEQTGLNQFDITLKVITQQTVTQNASAIQLVIDRSNSMNYCAACGEKDTDDCDCNVGDRMTAVKNAITGENGFLDQLLAGNEGKLYISVVAFSGSNNNSSVKDAYTVLDWTELTAQSKSAVASAVDGISANGGTNLQAGLSLAANRLSMADIASCSTKYTVLLTDGAPTYYTSTSSSSTSEITSTAGSGSSASSETVNGGITAANAVKSLSTLYTICYGVSDEVVLEGETTKTCAHCNENRNDHYVLCTNCKQARSAHTSFNRCPNSNYRSYNAGYFCDANGNTQFEAAVTAALTVGQYLSGSIASAATNAYNANDIAGVYEAFSNIADSAIEGMNGAGTSVTDPMGEFIVLGDVSGNSVSASNNALTWTLDPANAEKTVSGNVTTYTYTYTYPITLDTSAQGFKELNDDGSVKYYPANGYTYLSAVVDGQDVKIPFNVPGVCGEIPEYNWRVEYYLENEQGGYTLDDTDDMGSADLWSSVNAPEGYKGKYNDRHYEFASGNTVMQITAGENVMKLYYNYDMAGVTVNHFYKTTVIEADGSVSTGEYPQIPQITDSASKWIGTNFSAAQQNNFGGAVYELDKVDPKDAEITVSADEDKNVINFYYSREEDRRADTSAEVKHIYKTYGYELQNGKYVLVEKSSVTESAQSAANLKATTTYAVTATAPLSGYADFTLNTAAGDYIDLLQADSTLSFVLADNAQDNVRTLVFEQTVDERIPVQVTVNHYYTKSTTSVQDGNVVTVIDPNKELGKSKSFTGYYKNETFTASQYNAYEGDTYISDAQNAVKCEQITLSGDTTIDLYYNLAVAPDPISITVNHYWRTFTDVTIEDTDSETDRVIGTEVITETTVDHKIENITVSDLFAGQNYTAALEAREGGYTFNEQESNRTIIAQDGAVINLYYDRDATADARTDADIDVLHTYTTYLTTIVGGEVKTVTLNDGTVSESFPAGAETLKAGDVFTAVAKPVYKENSYSQITGESALTVILQPGTNGSIEIEYIRRVSDLVPVTYNVNYVYNTYTMTVNAEGVAGYWNAPAVETIGSVADVPGYVNQQVILSAGEREGFVPVAGNPATVQILKSEGNTWTFVYEKYIPLGMGSIVVNHHYKTTTIAENGTASVSNEDVYGTAAQMYLGEIFQAESLLGTFQLVSATVDGAAADLDVRVVISGDNVVDFYYEKTVDNSRLVDYTVSHIYNLYTYDGELISSQKAEDITGSGFVTTPFTAVPSPAGYELVSSTYNGAALEAPYTIALADGRNEIVFVYEQHQPREKVDVTVIHNYYASEEDMGSDPAEVYEQIISDIDEDTEYAAQLREEEGYEFHSATPSSMVITATKDGENVIIVNYTKIVEEPPVEEPPVEEPPVEEPPVIEIPDEDIPMADVPKTGDATVLYAVLTALSGTGLAALGLKKKEDDEE